ncbi:uncharacterized protein LOC116699576 [Lates japonicus]
MNTTSTPTVSTYSSAGLAVGLTISFLLVGIVAGVIVYKYRNKIRSRLLSGRRESQKKEDYSETAQAESHEYTSAIREQSSGHTPIYENLTTRNTGYDRPAGNQSRLHGEPEEDLYLQCDVPDDAIYCNDPKCNLAILPNSQDEDVYIMPDS